MTTLKKILTLLVLLGLAVPASADHDDADTSHTDADVSTSVDATVTPKPRLQGTFRVDVKGEVRPGVGVGSADLITRAKERADLEIARRIDALNALLARLNNAEKVSEETKAEVQAKVTAQLAELTALRARIANSTSTTSLKTDIQSIRQGQRVFAVTMPKAAIAAAADRITAVASQMAQFSAKLSARIDAAAEGDTDVTELEAMLTEYDTKLAEAKAKAEAAVTLTKNLYADNGDEEKFKENLAALKAARMNIADAQKLLNEARQIARKIIVEVKGMGSVNVEVEASADAGTE